MGDVLGAIEAIGDPEQLEAVCAAAVAKLAEMAQVVEPERELRPCDPNAPLLLLLRDPLQLTTPPTAADIERVALAARIEYSRMQALLCGWDTPTEDEADQLHAAVGPALVPRLIHKYFEIRALSAVDIKTPSGGDV
jgi:hypothetical protein